MDVVCLVLLEFGGFKLRSVHLLGDFPFAASLVAETIVPIPRDTDQVLGRSNVMFFAPCFGSSVTEFWNG
jgi:hypothetical protein